MNSTITEEILNAYVDGELAPDQSAEVALAVARDPAMAARVAALSRVKSSLSGMAVVPPRSIVLAGPRWSKGLVAAAACFGLCLALLSALATGYLPYTAQTDGWYRSAAVHHAAWAMERPSPNAPLIDANRYLIGVNRLQLPVHAPDLTSANLRLTYFRYYGERDGNRPALHLGYTGRRGCQVTLWVTAAERGLAAKLTETRQGDMRGFRWRVGEVAYALFATGMNEARLTAISEKVYEATSSGRGFNDESRIALEEASRGAPCLS